MKQGINITVCGCGHIHLGMTDDASEAIDLAGTLLYAAEDADEVAGGDDRPVAPSEVH